MKASSIFFLTGLSLILRTIEGLVCEFHSDIRDQILNDFDEWLPAASRRPPSALFSHLCNISKTKKAVAVNDEYDFDQFLRFLSELRRRLAKEQQAYEIKIHEYQAKIEKIKRRVLPILRRDLPKMEVELEIYKKKKLLVDQKIEIIAEFFEYCENNTCGIALPLDSDLVEEEVGFGFYEYQ